MRALPAVLTLARLMRNIMALMAIVAPISIAHAASTYDGLWKPVGNTYMCEPTDQGGAILIKGPWYGDPESDCTMANPTAVRGFEGGTLFDVTCKGDWGSRSQRELFMRYRNADDEERLVMVTPHGAGEFVRCPE